MAVTATTTDLPDLYLVTSAGQRRLTHVNPQVDTWLLPQIEIVTWTSGDGTFKTRNRIMAPDMTTVLVESREVAFQLSSSRRTHIVITVFPGVMFSVEGSHWVEALLDGEIVCRYPLWIRRAAQGGAPREAPEESIQ